LSGRAERERTLAVPGYRGAGKRAAVARMIVAAWCILWFLLEHAYESSGNLLQNGTHVRKFALG